MPVVVGKFRASTVQTLRDTGCTGVVVSQSLVSEQDMTGTHYTCLLIDGTVRRFSLARVKIRLTTRG